MNNNSRPQPYLVEAFQFPSPIEGCSCLICSRAGVDSTFVEPPSVWEMYTLRSVPNDGPTHMSPVTAATAVDAQELSAKCGSKVDWMSSKDPKDYPWYRFCNGILKVLMKRREAGPFKEPVDWKKLQLPDYPQIVKHPMDLGTIDTCLQTGLYINRDDFVSDVRLVFRNSYLFNPQGNPVRTMAQTLSLVFEEALAQEHQSFVRR